MSLAERRVPCLVSAQLPRWYLFLPLRAVYNRLDLHSLYWGDTPFYVEIVDYKDVVLIKGL